MRKLKVLITTSWKGSPFCEWLGEKSVANMSCGIGTLWGRGWPFLPGAMRSICALMTKTASCPCKGWAYRESTAQAFLPAPAALLVWMFPSWEGKLEKESGFLPWGLPGANEIPCGTRTLCPPGSSIDAGLHESWAQGTGSWQPWACCLVPPGQEMPAQKRPLETRRFCCGGQLTADPRPHVKGERMLLVPTPNPAASQTIN